MVLYNTAGSCKSGLAAPRCLLLTQSVWFCLFIDPCADFLPAVLDRLRPEFVDGPVDAPERSPACLRFVCVLGVARTKVGAIYEFLMKGKGDQRCP